MRVRPWGQGAIAGFFWLWSNGAMPSSAKRAPSAEQAALLRRLPSVDELLLRPLLAALCEKVDRVFALEAAREVLAELRREIMESGFSQSAPELENLESYLLQRLQKELSASLRTVINATGVILHTNLGRAPLPAGVSEEFRRSATQYSNLEYDLATGERGNRDAHTSRLLQRLTGAEAAVVVNNCAAAVLLTLAALARGGEVIVSRGELIEIGDGFRIPEIMEQSGAILREVGTTNRTRLADYEQAINEKTRLVLRVHPSNFKVTGFTEKPEIAELVELGKRAGVPVVEDLGSGCLVDLSKNGINEPIARASVEAGFSLVLFSGDKLLGGPQAGMIAGKKELVAKVRRHPLFRALRVDKLTIAALEFTLRSYLRAAWEEIPALRMIRMTREEIAARASNFVQQVRLNDVQIEVVDGASLIGGGSTPEQSLTTKLVRINSAKRSAGELESRLRAGHGGISVIARIEEDSLLIDLRTVFPEQEPALLDALVAALH
jgi:L-seryl-tRNA(Ser) seleniumtransferase